jgi:hypothetical protein
VVATARPIDAAVATEFAVAFHQVLTTGYSDENRQVTGGCSLAMAFAQAEGLSRAAPGGKPRDLVAEIPTQDDVIDDCGFPWMLQYRPGSEHIERWNLFEDDPLFGLPDLPTDIGWPVEPYRNLEYFQRDHARIFFGRGRAIRELYNLLTLPADSAEARLLFYYGQTGVGKTSVLAAGLLPRVETFFATRYYRRSEQRGLLGTLRDELAPGTEPFDLGAAWLEVEDKAQRPLVIVLDQAEEAFTKPLADLRPKEEIRALFEAVHEVFAPTRPERPRGRLILSFRKEWLAEFNEIRKALNLDIKPKMLDPLDRPGVIEAIEGPAKHFGLEIKPDRDQLKPGEVTLAEFMSHDLFDTLANPQTEQESPIAPTLQILLSRMWEEANDPKRFRGRPTFNPALYQELKGKGFKLDEVIQEQFDRIAGFDLRLMSWGDGSGVPTSGKNLVVVGTDNNGLLHIRILDAAGNRIVDTDETQLPAQAAAIATLKQQLPGLLPPHVLTDAEKAQVTGEATSIVGQTEIAEVTGLREAVEKGLLLDLLEFFTTREGTADTRTRQQIHDRYPHQPAERLDALLEACQNRYLLAHVGVGADGTAAYRLTHDTLAPLLRERFRVSPDVAQRARRLLEGRAATWKGQLTDPVLDRVDLDFVEAGLSWMRALEKNEPALLEASRLAEKRRVAEEAERQRQLREAREREEQARAEKQRETELRLKQQEDANQQQQQANRRLRHRAYGLLVMLAATLALTAFAFYQWRDARKQTAIANEETAKAEEAAKAEKEQADIANAEKQRADEKAAMAESRRLAVLSDSVRPERLDLAMLLASEAAKEGDTLEARGSLQRSLDARPEVARFLHVPEGDVTSVAFGPEGQIAAGYGVGGARGGVVLFDTRGERLRLAPLEVKEGHVNSVVFGPEGQIAAGYGYFAGAGGVVLFDARGQRPRPTPLEVKEGHVTSVALGPEGQIAAGYGGGARGGVVLFDARGQRLRPTPLEVREGHVTSVAFGPEGQIAAGYGVGGVVLFDTRGERLRLAPLEVKEGHVNSVAFGPEGRIAAGYGDYRDGVGVGGGVVLFGARGERLRPAPLEVKEGLVNTVAFGPEGQIAAGYGVYRGGEWVGGVVLFDTRGEWVRRATLEVKQGSFTSVTFGPEGQIAAGYSIGDGRGGVVLFDTRGERLRRATLEVKEGSVTSVALGPEGKIAAGSPGGIVLFDARSERLRPAPLEVKEGHVNSVAFGPEGKAAAGYVGVGRVGGVVLFDARGERLRPAPLLVKEGEVRSVAFGPEGKIAAGYSIGVGLGGVVLFDARGERLRPAPLEVHEGDVSSVAFGPEGQIAAGYGVVVGFGGVVVFDAHGEWLRPTPLDVHEGQVKSVAFGPEGQIAAGYSNVYSGGVVLFGARGERLRPAPLEVKEGHVNSVAFGPEGRIAAGYGDYRDGVGVGGVVLFDTRGERLRPAPLLVKEGEVSSVAFGPDGTIAAGYSRGPGSGGGVVLLDGSPASWRAKLEHVANRNFTWEEWRQYFLDTPYRRTIRSLPWPYDLPEAERKQAEAFEKEHPEGSDAS